MSVPKPYDEIKEFPELNTALGTLEEFFEHSLIWKDLQALFKHELENKRLWLEEGSGDQYGDSESRGQIAQVRAFIAIGELVLRLKRYQLEERAEKEEEESQDV